MSPSLYGGGLGGSGPYGYGAGGASSLLSGYGTGPGLGRMGMGMGGSHMDHHYPPSSMMMMNPSSSSYQTSGFNPYDDNDPSKTRTSTGHGTSAASSSSLGLSSFELPDWDRLAKKPIPPAKPAGVAGMEQSPELRRHPVSGSGSSPAIGKTPRPILKPKVKEKADNFTHTMYMHQNSAELAIN